MTILNHRPPHRCELRLYIALAGIIGAVSTSVGQPPVNEPIPALEVKSGTNLFGEKINSSQSVLNQPVQSRNVKRVIALIARNSELMARESEIHTRYLELTRQLGDKTAALKQLPGHYESALAQFSIAASNLELLGSVSTLSPDHPTAKSYFRVRAEMQGLAGEIKLMEQQNQIIPIEMRNIKAEVDALRNTKNLLDQDLLMLVVSWNDSLNLLSFVPRTDAESIVGECQIALDNNVNAHSLRMMLAYARIHQEQVQAAIPDLQRVYQAMSSQDNRFASAIRLRCLVGIAWAEIKQQHLDEAASVLNEARKISPRDYEVAILLAHVAELRGKPSAAFSLYKNATSIATKRPDAYRWASEMTAKTAVRPPEIALSLAQRACELDELSDFRNSLALARAYHACARPTERDDAMAKAFDQAIDSGNLIVETVAKELHSDVIAKKLTEKELE